jgi:hypothetical protein
MAGATWTGPRDAATSCVVAPQEPGHGGTVERCPPSSNRHSAGQTPVDPGVKWLCASSNRAELRFRLQCTVTGLYVERESGAG